MNDLKINRKYKASYVINLILFVLTILAITYISINLETNDKLTLIVLSIYFIFQIAIIAQMDSYLRNPRRKNLKSVAFFSFLTTILFFLVMLVMVWYNLSAKLVSKTYVPEIVIVVATFSLIALVANAVLNKVFERYLVNQQIAYSQYIITIGEEEIFLDTRGIPIDAYLIQKDKDWKRTRKVRNWDISNQLSLIAETAINLTGVEKTKVVIDQKTKIEYEGQITRNTVINVLPKNGFFYAQKGNFGWKTFTVSVKGEVLFLNEKFKVVNLQKVIVDKLVHYFHPDTKYVVFLPPRFIDSNHIGIGSIFELLSIPKYETYELKVGMTNFDEDIKQGVIPVKNEKK